MPEREDMVAVRRQILDLLRQQMEALDSRQGLTDARLSECYERQARVQELREKLQAAGNSAIEVDRRSQQGSTPTQAEACAAAETVNSADATASL
jgi:hypothetical protein